MYLEDINSSFQIRLVNDDPTIKTSRTKQRRIQDLRTVRSCKKQQPFICIESIHFRKKLIQRLLTLIVSAELAVPALTDCIDLIDEDDTRSHLLSLFEKVSHSGSTYTDIHLNKRRTGQRKERHIRLTSNRFRKKSLTCSRRSHKQCTFRKFRTDTGIFPRIMKEIYYFLQRFLCLILSGNILKCNTGRLFHIHLGIALTDPHHSAAFRHSSHQIDGHPDQKYERKHCCKEVHNNVWCRIRYLVAELHAGIQQFLCKVRIIYNSSIILFFRSKDTLFIFLLILFYSTLNHSALISCLILLRCDLTLALRFDHDPV